MSDARERPRPLARGVGLDAAALAQQRAFFELGETDAAALRAMRPIAEASVEDVVARFYEHILAFPELREILEREPGRLDRLKALQRSYFLSLTDGEVDDAYVESRLQVGNVHQAIGVEPSWYIGAFALYLRLALRELVARTGDGTQILPTIEALVKTIAFDMALAMRTYVHGGFVARGVANQLEQAAALAREALEGRAETERLKDELSAMVVHDLKNPVNGISMMVQLALRKGADLPEAHRSYLQQIDLTCREMMRLIQNLLEITKIEEGKLSVERESVALAEIVEEVGREYSLAAEQAGRTLRIEIPSELPRLVADRALIKRVLVNLVANALRHSGSPEVRIEGIHGPATDLVTLRVIDRGTGFRAEDLPRVFEKFRSVQRSPASEPVSDTGLGLPFCKLAVELMGGSIGVESSPGEQTTFWVMLPRSSS